MSGLILPDSVKKELKDLTTFDYKDFTCEVKKSGVYHDLGIYHGVGHREDPKMDRAVNFTVNDVSYEGARKQLEFLIDMYYKQTRH